MKRIRFTLALRPTRRWPGFRVRVSHRKVHYDEVLFPIVMEIPDALLDRRKPETTLVVDPAAAIKAKVES